jgi:hypothetical protein
VLFRVRRGFYRPTSAYVSSGWKADVNGYSANGGIELVACLRTSAATRSFSSARVPILCPQDVQRMIESRQRHDPD